MKIFGIEVDTDKVLFGASIIFGAGSLIISNARTARQIDDAVEKRMLLLENKKDNDESEE